MEFTLWEGVFILCPSPNLTSRSRVTTADPWSFLKPLCGCHLSYAGWARHHMGHLSQGALRTPASRGGAPCGKASLPMAPGGHFFTLWDITGGWCRRKQANGSPRKDQEGLPCPLHAPRGRGGGLGASPEGSALLCPLMPVSSVPVTARSEMVLPLGWSRRSSGIGSNTHQQATHARAPYSQMPKPHLRGACGVREVGVCPRPTEGAPHVSLLPSYARGLPHEKIKSTAQPHL